MDAAEIIENLPEDRCDAIGSDRMRCVLESGHIGAHSLLLSYEEDPANASTETAADRRSGKPQEEEIPEGMAACPLCHGGGLVPAELHMAKDAKPCPDCGMIGKVARPTYVQEEIMQQCGTCNGAGWIYAPPPQPEQPQQLPPEPQPQPAY